MGSFRESHSSRNYNNYNKEIPPIKLGKFTNQISRPMRSRLGTRQKLMRLSRIPIDRCCCTLHRHRVTHRHQQCGERQVSYQDMHRQVNPRTQLQINKSSIGGQIVWVETLTRSTLPTPSVGILEHAPTLVFRSCFGPEHRQSETACGDSIWYVRASRPRRSWKRPKFQQLTNPKGRDAVLFRHSP